MDARDDTGEATKVVLWTVFVHDLPTSLFGSDF
jgi:hypothetical protein